MDEKKEINFQPISEPWTEYELEDGTRLRLRLIMTMVSDRGQKDQKGRPTFDFEFQAVARVITKDKNQEVGQS